MFFLRFNLHTVKYTNCKCNVCCVTQMPVKIWINMDYGISIPPKVLHAILYSRPFLHPQF